MLTIDGSQGEGGGQILRTSLALSLVTGTAFRIEKIRAGRRKPGLMRQHLTAVEAAGRIGAAEVSGADPGSKLLTFRPGTIRPGSHTFAVGTAGSATLVLQTVLPALLRTAEPSFLTLEGGTHNPLAPPFEFLAHAFLPLLNRLGPRVEALLDRPGFYPAGGGRLRVRVRPAPSLAPIDLTERGAVRGRQARAVVSNLPLHIARRELKTLERMLPWGKGSFRAEEIENARGPGNAVIVTVRSERVTEVFSGFGQRGVRAETVAETVGREVCRYLEAEVPVGPHLADQLLIPLALAGGGSFRTVKPTAHTTTNIEVIRRFLEIEVQTSRLAEDAVEVALGPPSRD